MMKKVDKDNFELCATDVYEGRCGVIFITQKREFILHCSLCNCKYEDYTQFVEHVLTKHYHEEKEKDSADESYTVIIPVIEKFPEGHQQQIEVATEERQQTIKVDIKVGEEYELFEVQVEDGQTEAVEQSLTESEQLEEETIEIDPVYEIEYDSKNTSFNESEHRKIKALSSIKINLRPGNEKNVAEDFKVFIDSKTLKSHTSPNFNQIRKFQCEHCGFAFKEEYNLRAHLRRHTNPKQFSCTQCTKKFHTRSELSTHERRHTGERPFACPLCNVSFVTSGAMCEHAKRHTNNRTHKCEFCEKFFYDTFQLKEHLVVHTQERNHICNICNAAFSRHKSLVVHMKLHANERQYICNICKMAFNQKQALTSHFKSKHKQKNNFVGEMEEKGNSDIVEIKTSIKKQENTYSDSLAIHEVHEDDCTDLFV